MMPAVRHPVLTVALLWTAGYLVVYLLVVQSQGDQPARWYVLLLSLAVLALCFAVIGEGHRPLIVAAVVMLAVATLAGLLSIGLLLLPALAAAAFAAVRRED